MKAYIVLRLQTSSQTSYGWPINLHTPSTGHLGMMSVYATKKAARKVYGEDIQLQEISITEIQVKVTK